MNKPPLDGAYFYKEITMGSLTHVFEEYGIEQITTFDMDFDIAECFGVNAIKDTYERAFNEWKGDYKYLTELVIVLNWKIWQWFTRNDEIGRLYDSLWKKTQNYAYNNLKGDELTYFWRMTD